MQTHFRAQNLGIWLILLIMGITIYNVIQDKPVTKSLTDIPLRIVQLEPATISTNLTTPDRLQAAPTVEIVVAISEHSKETSTNQEEIQTKAALYQITPTPDNLDDKIQEQTVTGSFDVSFKDRLMTIEKQIDGLSNIVAGGFNIINRLHLDNKQDEQMNVLLMGVDKRPQEKYGRTDAMILVTIDPISKTAGMLSVPRDLWVTVPGYGQQRINTAYFLGEVNNYTGGGPALAMETVQNTLGIPIHFYALIDFDGFRKIVDTLDGIEVCVAEPVEIFEVGWQTMDSETALYYVRTRATANADFGRVQRQQAVLWAMRDKTLQLGIIPKLPKLWTSTTEAIDTDLSLLNLLTIAHLASKIELEHIRFAAIDHTMTTNYTTPSGAQVLLPRYDKIKIVTDEMFFGLVPPGGSALTQASVWELEMETLCPE